MLRAPETRLTEVTVRRMYYIHEDSGDEIVRAIFTFVRGVRG